MANFDFKLHLKQQDVFFSEARFKVCAAGRRGGKTYLAAVILIIEALRSETSYGRPLTSANAVWYVAPTYSQAKDIMWAQLKELACPLGGKAKEKELTITMPNNRMIVLKGSDREDTLRGISLSYLVLDEYADMKPHVFDLILSPALSDCLGGALFIGTPKGKNHFFDIWESAQSEDWDDWEGFHFCSIDNPMIPRSEIENARRRMTAAAFSQEYEANFTAGGGTHFKREHIIIEKALRGEVGTTYIAVDPNGYKDTKNITGSKLTKLDETSIAVVECRVDGWWVKDMIHGRWTTRETSLQIIRACQKYRPASCGIENLDVIMPYLEDQMRRLNIYPNIVPLKHGGQRKTDRIMWALAGRFENKRIKFIEAPWNSWLTDQLMDFPSPLAHDDGPDSLAYIDQLAVTVYQDDVIYDDWEPEDETIGY